MEEPHYPDPVRGIRACGHTHPSPTEAPHEAVSPASPTEAEGAPDAMSSTSDPTFDLPISYRNTLLGVPVTAATLVGELKAMISDLTDIPPSAQKLSHKGKLLGADKDGATLREAFAFAGDEPKPLPKLLLVGTTARSIEEIQRESARILNTLANRKKYLATASMASRPVRTLGDDPEAQYTFLSTSILPSPPYPNPGGALAILDRIRDDPGIRHIMREHKFTIGLLSELSPFERTILGFNKNKGQEISLRLRTDNLEGFRSYGAIRRVLIHELTHCVWSEHDNRFNELNSQLTKELMAFERRMKQDGRTLGAIEYHYEPEDEGGEKEAIDSHGYEGQAAVELKAEAGGLRAEEWRERERNWDRREVLRLATEQRLKKPSQGGGS
ncbi:WLM domain-containing protein [Hyaloraphidium curvatum]|nr:WLM domain-containing protein [Hyaloraphidium curvatum]